MSNVAGQGGTSHTSNGGYSGEAGAQADAGGQAGAGTLPQSSELVALADSPVSLREDSAGVELVLTGYDRTGQVSAEDLSVMVDREPMYGRLVAQAGAVPLTTSYYAARDFFGADSLRFYVHNGEVRSASATVRFEVAPVNDAPIAHDDAAVTTSSQPVVIDILANDVDIDDNVFGSHFGVQLTGQPVFGSAVVLENHQVRYTPAYPSTGLVSFDYQLTDPAGATSTATVSVDVQETPPVRITSFSADQQQVAPGESVTLSWQAENTSGCSIEGVAAGLAEAGSIVYMATSPVLLTLTCEGLPTAAMRQLLIVALSGDEPDTDGDGISDAVEDLTQTDTDDPDSDDDGVPDGVEDQNGNGMRDPGELNPLDPDSDDDGACDGLRFDNDADGLAPASDCLGPVLVDAGSTNETQDGTTWPTAFSTLQAGVDLAGGEREVWVRVGRYLAAEANQTVVTLGDRAQVFGGFFGTETYRQARDPASRETIVDGDFLQDDTESLLANRLDNSRRVVATLGSGRLDGFVIQNGHNEGAGLWLGAGINIIAPDFELRNVELRRHYSISDGAALGCEQSCAVSISDAVFEGNQGSNGGAVSTSTNDPTSQVSMTFSRVVFSNNTAVPGIGGGMYVGTYATVEGSDLLFEDNSANYGGAVAHRGNIIFDAVVFRENTAASLGGALYTEGIEYEGDSEGHFFATDTEWSNNSANLGGAVYAAEGSVTLETGQFIENSANVGGAVYGRNADLEFFGVDFIINTANRTGAILQFSGYMQIDGCQFAGNSASSYGAVRTFWSTDYPEERPNQTIISNTTFGANIATASLTADTDAGRGGAMEHVGGTLTLSDVEFSGNIGQERGGGLRCANAVCDLKRVAFVKNSALYGGGMDCSATSEGRCDYEDCLFRDNSATLGGGLYQYSGTSTLVGAAFVWNQAEQGGGAYAVANLAGLGVAFVENTASVSGGGMQLASYYASLRGVTFARNTAPNGAAAFTSGGAIARFADTRFADNLAAEAGGAVHNVDTELIVTSASFAENQADRGAGIFHSGSKVATVTNASFWQNRATSSGAGVLSESTLATRIYNSLFFGNQDDGSGPDVVDLGTASEPEYVFSAQPLSGPTLTTLTQTPYVISDASGLLFLDQEQALLVDGGSSAWAAQAMYGFSGMGMRPFGEQTTASSGQLDTGAVDPGRHFPQSAVAISTINASEDQLSWTARNASRCLWFCDESDFTGEWQSGATNVADDCGSGATLTLVCFRTSVANPTAPAVASVVMP